MLVSPNERTHLANKVMWIYLNLYLHLRLWCQADVQIESGGSLYELPFPTR